MNSQTVEENNLLHQDWKTIVLKGKHPENVEKNKQKDYKVKKVNNEKKIEKKINDDNLKHDKYSSDLIKQMITYRQKNKLNQKQFAQKLNIPVKTINDIESNRGIYNPNINNKIKRIIKM